MDIGSRVGPYEIKESIGEGGMAVVYKAWHTGLHRFEALKVPRFQGTQGANPDFIQRLLTEARIAAQLHHPHIVAIHNVSEPEAPVQFFAMDLVDGVDLAALLKQCGRLPLDEALPILRQVSAALDYAHRRGFIHRDIKPGNILLQEGPVPGEWFAKVVDFGISRAAEDDGGTRLTKSGMIVGTPEYMSPEQAGSGDPVDRRTDIYSLGIVAYEMLCGHPPFTAGEGVSRMSILMSHVHHLPRPLVEQIPGLSLAANNAVLKALAKHTDDRFITCEEFIRALSGEVLVFPPAATEAVRVAPAPRATLPTLATPSSQAPTNTPQAPAKEGVLFRGTPETSTPEKSDQSHPLSANGTTASPLAGSESATLTAQPSDKAVSATPPVAPPPVAAQATPETDGVRKKQSSSRLMPALLGAAVIGLAGGSFFLMNRDHTPGGDTTKALATNTVTVSTLAPVASPVPTAGASVTTATTHQVTATPTTATPKITTPAQEVKHISRMQVVPFTTRIEKTASLLLGQKHLQQKGQAGQRQVTVEIITQGLRQISRRITDSHVVKQPVPQLELVGTASPPAPRPHIAPHAVPHHAVPHSAPVQSIHRRVVPRFVAPRRMVEHQQHTWHPQKRWPATA
ncbi:MAG: protein kinase, partial [Abitibacteriaceae bacterium]|nr:protein kinase [Abditibacteriaceae bacterium]